LPPKVGRATSTAVNHKALMGGAFSSSFRRSAKKESTLSVPIAAIKLGAVDKHPNINPKHDTITPKRTIISCGNDTDAVTNLSTFSVRLDIVIPNSQLTVRYTRVELMIAQKVPFGILCEGVLRNALLDMPANIPVTHGYINAKQLKKLGVTPVYGSGSYRGHTFSINDLSYGCKLPSSNPIANNAHPTVMHNILDNVTQMNTLENNVTYFVPICTHPAILTTNTSAIICTSYLNTCPENPYPHRA
jgi:hypothetical protein